MKRSYHHGDLRAALLDEAAAMIAESGVESLTMRAVSARLGVSRTAPYRHFEDKGDLLVAIATTGFARLEERLRSVEPSSGASSIEGIRALGSEYVRFALENPAHYRLMYGREALARREHPALQHAADALFGLLVDAIRTHQDRGGIRQEDPEVLAYVAWSAMHGLASLLIERQIQPKVDDAELIDRATRTLLDGLRERSSESAR